MVKVSGADSPPLSFGSKTVSEKLPAATISVASIAVFNCVESTNAVVLSRPLTRITKPLTNPVPLTVRLNPAPPAIALEGERLLTLGAMAVKANLGQLKPGTPAGMAPALARWEPRSLAEDLSENCVD